MMNQKREAAVWERVMAASAECPAPVKQQRQAGLQAQQVMELLEQELADACTYRMLAARMGKQGRPLLRLAQEEQGHSRKLEAIYYLLTGQRASPQRPKAPCVACTNEELRRRYQEEVASAARYHELAEQAGSFAPELHCMGQEEERHSCVILQLLQRCL